mmetsp:Transcript_8844/g.18858  ORF Transcript_8844/g.18858 Transcript_8844/m.18858 type:complete len:248 (-) Transcript_8844:202-945(-)
MPSDSAASLVAGRLCAVLRGASRHAPFSKAGGDGSSACSRFPGLPGCVSPLCKDEMPLPSESIRASPTASTALGDGTASAMGAAGSDAAVNVVTLLAKTGANPLAKGGVTVEVKETTAQGSEAAAEQRTCLKEAPATAFSSPAAKVCSGAGFCPTTMFSLCGRMLRVLVGDPVAGPHRHRGGPAVTPCNVEPPTPVLRSLLERANGASEGQHVCVLLGGRRTLVLAGDSEATSFCLDAPKLGAAGKI